MLAGGSGGGGSQNVDCDKFPLHYLSYICQNTLSVCVCVCVTIAEEEKNKKRKNSMRRIRRV
jgi:hypothetical protein